MSSSLAERSAVEEVESPARGFDFGSAVIIVVAAAAMAATLPGRTFGLGLVTEPLMRDLELSASAWAHVNLAATLVGALFCFPVGWLLDRYGAPRVLMGTLAALGGVTFALGRATDYWTLVVLVTLTRGFGQSALSVVSITLVGKSFDRRLSWPMATYSVLMSIAFVIVFQTIGHFLKQPDADWRNVWEGLGISLSIAGPLGWLALRGCDLKRRTEGAAAADTAATGASGFTLAEALRTPAFWIFAGATSLFGLAAAGLALFNLPVLKERGLTLEDFLALQMVTTPLGLLGQACCGMSAKKFSYQRILAGAMLVYALGLVGLTMISNRTGMFLAGSAIGLSGGMITVIFFAVWSRLFGLRELGRIQGAAQMATVFASAVGPELFGLAHGRYASYIPALYLLAPAVVAMGIACWFTPAPRHASRSEFGSVS